MVYCIKTTVELPDELLIEAKKRAAELRKPLKTLIEAGLREQLEKTDPARDRCRHQSTHLRPSLGRSRAREGPGGAAGCVRSVCGMGNCVALCGGVLDGRHASVGGAVVGELLDAAVLNGVPLPSPKRAHLLKDVDWFELRAQCRPIVEEPDSGYDLWITEAMECLLGPLEDWHLGVRDADGEWHAYGLPNYAINYTQALIAGYLEGGGIVTADGAVL